MNSCTVRLLKLPLCHSYCKCFWFCAVCDCSGFLSDSCTTISSLTPVWEQSVHSPTLRCLSCYGNASKDMRSPGLLLRTKCYSRLGPHEVRNARGGNCYLLSAEMLSCVPNVSNITAIIQLSSAPLQVWRCVHAEAPAFRRLAGQTDGGPEGPVHLVQPCTQPVHQCDHARWAEPHRCPAALCLRPVSQGVSHSCCGGLRCYGVPGV